MTEHSTNNAFDFLLALSHRQPQKFVEKTDYTKGKSIIGVVINGQKLYVPLHQVGTILNKQPVTPMDYTQDWFAGIVRNGTNFVSVYDLAAYPVRPLKKEKAEVLICLTAEEGIDGHYGILVSRVEETVTLTEAPQRAEAEDMPYSLAYHFNDSTIQVLSLSKLASSDAFSTITNF